MDEVGFALDLLRCLLPCCRSVFCGLMSPWICLCLLPATACLWLAWLAAALGDRLWFSLGVSVDGRKSHYRFLSVQDLVVPIKFSSSSKQLTYNISWFSDSSSRNS